VERLGLGSLWSWREAPLRLKEKQVPLWKLRVFKMAKKPERRKEHPIRDLLTYFDQAHRARFGKPYRVLGGKDSKLAKDLLAVYSMADLCRWIDAFFASFDQFIRNSTYAFGVFASCVGKLIAAESPGIQLKPKTVRTLQGIYGD
jgi:hypothetical protein